MATTTTVAAAAGQGPRRGRGEAAVAVAPTIVYHPSGMVAPGVVPYMAAPRAPTPAAEVVGNSFVNQFYTILHSSPSVLYRFYTNDSTLIVSGEHGGASDAPTTYRTQRDIHNKVVSMRYDEAQADVKSIDASHTLGGGVLVQVTGALRRKGENFERNFVQSFLLAPQENGFFVLNDIVRYLDKVQIAGEEATAPKGDAVKKETAKQPAAAKTEAKVAKSEGGDKDKATTGEKEAVDNKVKSTEEKSGAIPDADPNKPRTYAMMAALASAAAAKSAGSASATPATPATPASASTSVSAPTTGKSSPTEKSGHTVAVTKPGCGIFIKNIFIDTTAEDLEREFSKFGVVLGGAKGINLKPPKLSHETKFAFIDFDEPASAQAALEATVQLHGKVLAVEMKKASVVNAKGVSGNGKKDSKGRSHGEGGGERKGGAKNGKKKADSAASNK